LSQSAHSELENFDHAARQLDRIYNIAHDLTRALDEIVWAVNPQHDTLDSLANYLGKFAQDFVGPLQIRCRLDLPVQLPSWPLTAEVRHNLFLAFKEALNNVLKHAGASEVLIALTTDERTFTFAVRDNGKGFAPGNPPQRARPGGNGLANMRQRMEALGGRCIVQSEPGHGTEVRFELAVRSHAT
jgi:signal transduction histidine kinase